MCCMHSLGHGTGRCGSGHEAFTLLRLRQAHLAGGALPDHCGHLDPLSSAKVFAEAVCALALQIVVDFLQETCCLTPGNSRQSFTRHCLRLLTPVNDWQNERPRLLLAKLRLSVQQMQSAMQATSSSSLAASIVCRSGTFQARPSQPAILQKTVCSCAHLVKNPGTLVIDGHPVAGSAI